MRRGRVVGIPEIMMALLCLSNSMLRAGGSEEGGEEVFILGGRFRLWTDVSRAPMFRVQRWRYEPLWRRPAPSASAADCQALDSQRHPTVLNTHRRLMEGGLMAQYPYLFREMCLGSGAQQESASVEAGVGGALGGLYGEKMFVAEAKRVWVLKHGAMITTASRAGGQSRQGGRGAGKSGPARTRAGGHEVVGNVFVQHVEYHSLEAPADAVDMSGMRVEYADALVNVAQAHAHNYYHFLCEVVPRLLMLPRKLLEDPRTKIFLPPLPRSTVSLAGGGGFVGGLLHLLGLAESCVLGGMDSPAQSAHSHGKGRLVLGMRVYFPSYSPFRIHSQTPRLGLRVARARLLSALGGAVFVRQEGEGGWRGKGIWADEGEARAGRSALVGAGGQEGLGGRRVLVSVRGPGSERGSEISDVQNWGEFLPVLARAFAQQIGETRGGAPGGEGGAGGVGWGVEAVEPGKMSLAEQARAFSLASAVVGAHGSNLANIVWLRDGGAVVEIHRPARERGPRYW